MAKRSKCSKSKGMPSPKATLSNVNLLGPTKRLTYDAPATTPSCVGVASRRLPPMAKAP